MQALRAGGGMPHRPFDPEGTDEEEKAENGTRTDPEEEEEDEDEEEGLFYDSDTSAGSHAEEADDVPLLASFNRRRRERRVSPKGRTGASPPHASATPPPSSVPHATTDEREASTIEYLFTGKLTLFPLAILFLGIGAGVLLRYGDKPYLHGYFESVEMYYGIAGLALAILAAGFFFALMLCIVLKISFTFSAESLLIKKHGVFRTAKLEFAIERTSLHYFRSHFSEEEAWLQLVIKEGNQFYQIFSWKGKGSQKDRFLKLFISLQRELARWQQRSVRYRVLGRPREPVSTEIVSKKEVNVISPFTHRLALLHNSHKHGGLGTPISGTGRPGGPLCIEDIAPISYDRFFRHFSHTKDAHRSSLPLSDRA